MKNNALTWSDKLTVDITSIDDQHKELISIFQELVNMLPMEAIPLSEKKKAFQALVDHAIDHFAYEEKIMRNIGYPEIDQHIAEHNDLRKEIDTISKQVANGDGIDDLAGIVSLVQVWLLRHIMASDIRIRDFVQRDPDV
ncbi:MAG: hemerythrin family protein [Magnetovibrio sp.]|nr:hemerythrin family protein [Magnetovibrio sp.]